MKYSAILPYFKRAGHLQNTLVSYSHFYKDRDDLEIIIAEDIKNIKDQKEHQLLHKVINKFPELNIKAISTCFEDCYNPTPLFNQAAKEAKGKYLVLTNPEIFHSVDVLKGADGFINKFPDSYLICGCLDVFPHNLFINEFQEFKYEPRVWYQHSKFRNTMFHFCSIISKDNYWKAGGFNELYAKGVAFDDDAFKWQVNQAGIDFVVCDDLLTFHINHDNAFRLPNYIDLISINKRIYSLQIQGKSNQEIEQILKEEK